MIRRLVYFTCDSCHTRQLADAAAPTVREAKNVAKNHGWRIANSSRATCGACLTTEAKAGQKVAA